MEELILLRQELHRNPELSGHERATGKRIRFFLNHYRPDELFTGIAGEGMAAIYNAPMEGPTLLFRCDLDALPIHESIERPYCSKMPGVSHVCGHDGHMAIVSGLALKISREPIKRGKVILFYQPESENGKGAKNSIKRLEELNLLPDYAFSMHNLPNYPLGSIVLPNNTFSAASKGLIFRLIGKESLAAHPEHGKNPALAISQIIQELNKLNNSKEFKNFVLLTVVHIRLGEVAFGTSPGFAEIMITLRSFSDADMSLLYKMSLEKVQRITSQHKLILETSITDDFPASTCNSELINTVQKITQKNNREVIVLKEPMRWSDDFAQFTINFPSILFGLGIGENLPELHSPEFDFPDSAIEHGVTLLDNIVSHFLRKEA